MKLKKIALRGLIGVVVLVALCMFFSGTIENITTPKVKIAQASRGKLSEKVELEGTLAFPETAEQRMELPSGQTLTITKVNVRAGYPVKAGDVVLQAEVAGYEAAAKQARDEYEAALDERMEVERKNEGVTLRRSEQSYADSYAALRAAARVSAREKTQMEVLLRSEKLSYSEEGYPQGASDELKTQIDKYRVAMEKQNAAQEEFDRAARYGVSDEAWTLITERQSAQEKLEDCENKLVELEELKRSAQSITAPYDGTIAEINLKVGDTYDGSMPLYIMTAQGSNPALRAKLGGIEKNITEGMKVYVGANAIEAQVTGVGFDEAGEKYADVALTNEIIQSVGSLYSMSVNPVKLVMQFTAAESSCLLPAAAVRGSEDERYVYVINEQTSTFGKRKLTLSKTPVHVIAEADGVASIEEDLSYYKIAYMEDRALSENSSVMEYVE